MPGLTRCPRGRLRVGGAGPGPGGRRGSLPAELLAPEQHVHGVAGVGGQPCERRPRAHPARTRPENCSRAQAWPRGRISTGAARRRLRGAEAA